MLTNALRQTSRAVMMGQRRLQSTKPDMCTAFLTAPKQQSFKKAWLSDPSTYPLIFVLGCAGVLCAGVGTACLACNPDVQISPQKRNSVVRTWSM